MDGFCVGEPWNHRAIADGVGITAATTQDIWKDHPEKTLGTTLEWAKKYPNTARALIAAVLEAGKWIDSGLQNKMKMAETVADKSYVNTSVDAITTDAQSVSGMKPMRTSSFSGLSEPAA
jgi:nitrate/nitrite transport system substrate-binding protein